MTSANEKLLEFLQAGGNITANQARQKFGIVNVSARANDLRRAGYAVYSNTRKTGSGRTIRVYQLGAPTRRVIAAGHLVLSDPYFSELLRPRIDAALNVI